MSFQNAGAIPRVKNAESTMMTVTIRLSAILLMARISLSHLSWSNVGVHLRRTLCAVMVERIVRNFILAVWLFHFPFKSKSPSPLHLCSAWSRSVHFQCERQRSPSRHLWRVMVERLVGFHFHWLFLASLFQIVSAGFVTFVLLWWKVHCARGCQYIS